MSVNWKQALAENPQFRGEEHWQLDIESLEVTDREAARQNLDICYEMRNGGVGRVVAEKYGVAPSSISRMMQRAFTMDEFGNFYLVRAMVPFTQIEKPRRHIPLSTKKHRRNDKYSLNEVFTQLPEFQPELYELVKACMQKKPYAINLTPLAFRDYALTILKESGWPLDVWPYSSKRKGYQTFRRYLIKLKDQINKENSDKRKSVEGVAPPSFAQMPLAEIQIDWQVTDLFARLTTEFEGCVTDTRLSRVCLLVAYDVKSRCILAWHLALTSDPSHEDVLQVIDNIYTQRKLDITHTPALEHYPGADYPSAVIPYMDMIGLNIISMDNAKANLAKAVGDRVCGTGALLRYAEGYQPLNRNFVEHIFHFINGLMHKLPSTTGSHANDPVREAAKHYKNAPEISLESVRELLDVWITLYNRTPKWHTFGETPLQRLERYAANQPLRISHNLRHTPRDFFIEYPKGSIYVNEKTNERPCVHHDGHTYSGKALTDRSLRGLPVLIKKDKRDLRTIEISTFEGRYLGKLYAQRAYLHCRFSRVTWQHMKKWVSEHGDLGPNPVYAYARVMFLNKGSPRMQTEFLRVAEEAKQDNVMIIGETKSDAPTPFDDEPRCPSVSVTPIKDLMKQQRFGAMHEEY